MNFGQFRPREWVLGMIVCLSLSVPLQANMTAFSYGPLETQTSPILQSTQQSPIHFSTVQTQNNTTTQSDPVFTSHAISSSNDNSIQVLGLWFINSNKTTNENVTVFRLLFNDFLFDGVPEQLLVNDIDPLGIVESKITSEPLFYPNPWKASGEAKLGFNVQTGSNAQLDLTLYIYNMMGRQILKKNLVAFNDFFTETFNASSFGGNELSAGVYFFLLQYTTESGETITKRGKFAVIP